MDISIIIATYKRSNVLKKTLHAMTLLNIGSTNWEILVVDNAQDPLTQECVDSFNKTLPIVYHISPTRGKSRALNLGITLAQGELIIFTDDDVIPDQQWLKEFILGTKRWPQYVSFGGRVLPENENKIPSAFKELKTYYLDFAIANWEEAEGPYSSEKVFGPNFAVRRNILNKGYRFNESLGPGVLFPFGDETHFLLSMEKDGLRPIYLPKVLVHHQIRDEQQTLGWLYQRAFNAGRSDVYESQKEKVPTLSGIPRFLIKQILQQLILKIKLISSNNYIYKIECHYKLYRIYGQIYQFWKIRNDTSST